MSERVRQPALAPPPIRPAQAWEAEPGALLEAHYRHLWMTRMYDMPFVNPALGVEAIGFRRHDGDWLGVMITPWFLNLFLIYGGGALWGDIPAGERRYLNLPRGTLQFLADDDPDLGPYQYCPLIAPVSVLPDMATARQAALEALATVLAPPPETPADPSAKSPGAVDEKPKPVSRRGFLSTLVGRW